LHITLNGSILDKKAKFPAELIVPPTICQQNGGTIDRDPVAKLKLSTT
jgi:hypothetical protein